ncbi:hypothetical protein Cs7R123_16660 [Catellatospora sp. TT07R-123]|uniref:DUF429 domain-containing protein n=1 Tax=Catellatospora sp. TT07R-123 TaxID=2733863 RepID=UPI001B06BEB7|nr:DUF429 domain-containing protein [Catellatospora sp. TT07R-123]GHJ44324.1 hypothetical protein Cs7R123_16660 [Catellatospora sp. TT07R-123]
MAVRVLGADACKAGWVGIVLDGTRVEAWFGATIAELLAAAETGGSVAVVGVDIPIGLPDSGRRSADELARVQAGVRRASVFMTPVRHALLAADHAEAVQRNRAATPSAEGISAQAYGLRERILDVDGWVRDQHRRVVEVHPELSFAAMAGGPLPSGKTTWAGAEQRRALLVEAGIVLASELGPVGRLARVDDVLDAAAAAWSARRVAAGTAACLPAEPEVFSDGLPAAIWT